MLGKSSIAANVEHMSAGFIGDPAMLPDGTIVDSARLPEGAVQEQSVSVSAERVMQSLGAIDPSLDRRNLRLVGPAESESRRLQRIEQAMMASDPLEIESAALRSLQRNLDESEGHVIQYHPVVLSDTSLMDSLGGIPGMHTEKRPVEQPHLFLPHII